ncbi:hypothetical protein [Haloferax sp. Atlit-6N]|uniref:hypothetical protein n=1 Tax=Haloferax sp. Atlit-6N TaxID=2077205 RepID=UPI0011C06A5F|nr:hypothetical protein [Haloferax sp. Atlit-6N]
MTDRPDGALSGVMWDLNRRLDAGQNHALVEGAPVDAMPIFEGYDRALHPWVRGWRPGELRETIRTRWTRLSSRLRLE